MFIFAGFLALSQNLACSLPLLFSPHPTPQASPRASWTALFLLELWLQFPCLEWLSKCHMLNSSLNPAHFTVRSNENYLRLSTKDNYLAYSSSPGCIYFIYRNGYSTMPCNLLLHSSVLCEYFPMPINTDLHFLMVSWYSIILMYRN